MLRLNKGPMSRVENERVEYAYNWIFAQGCNPDELRTVMTEDRHILAFSVETCGPDTFNHPKAEIEIRNDGRVLVGNRCIANIL